MTNFFRPASPASDHERFNPGLKLNDLSLKEREAVTEELHGISIVEKEDPELVRSAVTSLRQELGLVDCIVDDDTELLKFLRAESFDVKKAAIRFKRFADFQQNLFGKEGRIRYSDLSQEDRKYLQKGFMQLLPQRDRAGRAILICIGSLKQQLKTTVETDLRCLSFLASKAAEDEETQKRGLVMVYYAVAQKAYDSRNNRPLHLLKAFSELPARVVAAHFCFDNASMKPLVDFIAKHMESRMLCRFRSHCGQHIECQYNLMTFGIPRECLPIDPMGQVDLTNHHMLLNSVQLQDQFMDAVYVDQPTTEGKTFLIPGHLDIILGRGQHAKNSPGHLRFVKMLEESQARYEATEKSQKTKVANELLTQLKASGCRFLKVRPEGGWELASDDVGREKINHAFRNLRNNSAKKKNAGASKTVSPFLPSTSPVLPELMSSLSRKRVLDDPIGSGMHPLDFAGKKFFFV